MLQVIPRVSSTKVPGSIPGRGSYLRQVSLHSGIRPGNGKFCAYFGNYYTVSLVWHRYACKYTRPGILFSGWLNQWDKAGQRQVLCIHTPFPWCGILLYQAGYPFQWMAFARRLPVKFTAEMEGGKGSSRATFAV